MANKIREFDTEALVYTKNDCPNCDDTKSLMDSLEVSYTVVNIDENPDAKKEAKMAGFRQAPGVITNTDKWSGFNETKIRAIKTTQSFLDDDSLWD